MSDGIAFEIRIPSDEDGFLLLQCPKCGDYFKLTASDINDVSTLQIWCSTCGLVSSSYLTKDVIEIGMRLVHNHAVDLAEQFTKNINNMSRDSSFIKMSAKHDMKKETIDPIVARVKNLEVVEYPCCQKEAKINPSVAFAGGYCPFCGEMTNEDK